MYPNALNLVFSIFSTSGKQTFIPPSTFVSLNVSSPTNTLSDVNYVLGFNKDKIITLVQPLEEITFYG